MSKIQRRLFCFGLGYTASRLASVLAVDGWSVAGTCRSAEALATFTAAGMDAFMFDGTRPMDAPARALAGATHILTSVPPDDDGDPVLRHHGEDIMALSGAGGLQWVGYLSTTGVYGDAGGGWVDETSPLAPGGARGRRRVGAERSWLELHRDRGVAVHLFRLAGIYGPGRNAIEQIRSGVARRIVKPGHVFSRIHVDDIVAVLLASIARPHPAAAYNVCDDRPAASHDVMEFACGLLGVAPPPAADFADAELSPMARSFYADNRRVRNDRIKDELGVTLAYPDYEAGLRAILAAES